MIPRRSAVSRARDVALLAALCALAACGAVEDDPRNIDPPVDDGTTEFAPYFFTWAWGNTAAYAFQDLRDMKGKGGPSAVTLAFVLSDGSCNAKTDVASRRADIDAFVAAGGHVKAGFGGATGAYLENQCGSAAELAAAIGRFVDATGITDLDFDLEQHAVSSNPQINALRAAGLKLAQDSKRVKVSFTLPVGPAGLLQESIDILRAALDAGVQITRVNGMTLDYGNAATDLGTVPRRSIDAMALQLQGLIPGLTDAASYRLLGATAMIGKNDDGATFSLDNARTLVQYARDKRLGLVSFWAIHRDQMCPSGGDVATCSLVNTKSFEFSAIFAGVNAR